MQRFDILDPQLNIFESRFLEASAGTGKTFAIEHLFARFVQEGLGIQEVLAVTFTKDAAHEMKSRIREKLATDEEIPVFTIHSFCHRMLSEFAFEANAPFLLADPGSLGESNEMEQVVEDFFRTADPKFSAEIAILMKSSRFDIAQLKRKIKNAMEKQEPTLPVCLELPKIDKEALSADFHERAPHYKYFNPEKYLHQIDKYMSLKNPHSLLFEKEWFFEKMYEDNAKKAYRPTTPTIFESLRKQLLIARDPDEMIRRVAAECRRRWNFKAKRLDVHTFDDLLTKMDKALDTPQFLEKVRAKYKAVIVDEFQDTDPIQWRIFEKLFLKSHILYLVGDPKQSIYGFRSADIYTYMQASKALGKEKKAYLDTNFRSSPNLIDALNRLFTKHPEWIELPSLPGGLAYHPVHAGRTENKLDEPPIQGFLVEGSAVGERSWPGKQMEEEKLFPYIASELIRLHQTHSIPFSEMVVLVKDRYQGQRLQLHLNRWLIPSAIKRTLNLAESRGFYYMGRLLESTLEPDNDKKVRLFFLDSNPFYALKELFLEKGFAPYFAAFVKDHFRGDKELIMQLEQTAEILMEKRGSLEERIHFMDELKTKDPEQDERLKLRGEEGADATAIMTTFASKGLEFEVVFALDMASRKRGEATDEENAEKMRLLYVAFTRAREKLYIPLLHPMGGGSPLELFFSKWDSYDFPVDEVGEIPITPIETSQDKGEEKEEGIFNFHFPIKTLQSFTSMAKQSSHTVIKELFSLQDLTKKTPHTLPLGAETGILIHTIFEKIFDEPNLSLEQITIETLNGTHLEGFEEVVADMALSVLEMPLEGGFCLKDLKPGEYLQEMEFLFPQSKNKLIKGFADLVFKHDEIYYLLDWKTNWLGPSDSHYTEEKLQIAMQEHDYYLQASLYSEAITRFVKALLPNARFGGAYYIFVRGKKGVYFEPC